MRNKIVVFAVIVAVLGAACAYKLMSGRTGGITATGTIEVTRADITPKVSGYIGRMDIKEGDTVSRGQKVIAISRPDLEAQKLRDELALKKAEAQLTDLEKGSRSQELREAEAALNGVRSVYDKAKTDYARYRTLAGQGAIAAQQLDSARSAYEVAVTDLQAAQARLSLVAEGNRTDVIDAQRLEVERSKAVVQLDQTALDDTDVSSPLDGLVLTKNYEPGEYVNAGAAIVTIGDLRDCWVKVYVSSAQLGLIQVGQPVNVQVDSFPGQVFTGHIKEISQNAEFTPRQSITQQERANLVFAVKVKIDNDEGLLKPGMPADVVIK